MPKELMTKDTSSLVELRRTMDKRHLKVTSFKLRVTSSNAIMSRFQEFVNTSDDLIYASYSALLCHHSSVVKIFFSWKDGQIKILFLNLQSKMTHGVTGNTSDFGSEESRFEP
jgi:hypothetical protein